MKRILLAFLIALPQGSLGSGSPDFSVYPRESGSNLAESRIDEDLLRTYHREIQEIRETLAKNLPRAKRDSLVSERIGKRNQEDLRSFLKSPSLQPSPADAGLAGAAEAILGSIKEHPVVGEKAGRRYDPESRVGFCFGRAAFVHLDLLRRKIPASRIAKVFAVGKLYVGGVGWDHHVATMVRREDGSWLVIDSVAGRLLSLGDWMKEVTTWDWKQKTPSLRFYVTDAVKFRTMPGAYSDESLKWPEYKGYFLDLAKEFDPVSSNYGSKTAPTPLHKSQNGSDESVDRK